MFYYAVNPVSPIFISVISNECEISQWSFFQDSSHKVRNDKYTLGHHNYYNRISNGIVLNYHKNR